MTVRKVKLVVYRCRCERCAHEFTVVPPRRVPVRCPKCKAPGWQRAPRWRRT